MRGLFGLTSYILKLGIEISPLLNIELSYLKYEVCYMIHQPLLYYTLHIVKQPASAY